MVCYNKLYVIYMYNYIRKLNRVKHFSLGGNEIIYFLSYITLIHLSMCVIGSAVIFLLLLRLDLELDFVVKNSCIDVTRMYSFVPSGL
jgi:hypothetical protein